MTAAAANTTASEMPVPQAMSQDDRRAGRRWKPFNIAAIILSLVVFWPLGLFLFVWVLMDRQLRELPGIVQSQFNRLRAWMSSQHFSVRSTVSGNRVFDEFQQTQFDRIDEIKTEIKDRDNAFRDFKAAQDREVEVQQFETFMQKSPAAGGETVAA
jgi:hypothetical protein